MSTTAQSLLSDIEKLNAEARPIRDRIAEDQRELEQLRAQRSRIPEGIARGTEKESVIAENRRRVEIVEARLAGNRQLLAPIEARIREIQQRRQDHEAEENRRAQIAKFEQLKAEGASIAAGITEKLIRLVSSDIARFDEIRYRLASEFVDLGGSEEVVRLLSVLYDHSGGKRNYEGLYSAQLRRQGWKPFFRHTRKTGALPQVEFVVRGMNPPDR